VVGTTFAHLSSANDLSAEELRSKQWNRVEKRTTKGPIMAPNSENLENDGSTASGPIERVHQLSWSLFDELITDEEMVELEGLLLNDSTARDAYIRCVQLHADLTSHYAEPAKTSGATSKTPILGFLNEGMTQFGTPTADDART
jgi:hypothetical protein